MDSEIIFSPGIRNRFAIPADSVWVRIMVPPGVTGVYLFIQNSVPIYVGRSDYCLQSRLVCHELLAVASHVVWEPCLSSPVAYHLEAFWFHKLRESAGFLNQIHPACPANYDGECPFCAIGDQTVRTVLPSWNEQAISIVR